jgi:DNA-binding response OmpR family regulator
MLESSRVLKFYLAGLAEDGSASFVHKAMADTVESIGGVVLNSHRAKAEELQRLTKNGPKPELDKSLAVLNEADAFGAYPTVRGFAVGMELGFLIGRRIPGLVFTESPSSFMPFIKPGDPITTVPLPFPVDRELVASEVRKLIDGLVLSDPDLRKVVEDKDREQGFIRSGNISIDLRYKRVLHHIHQVTLDRIEYCIVERLAKGINHFIDRERIKAYCIKELGREDLTDNLFEENCAHAAYKINRLESPKRRYIDVFKGRYRLRRFVQNSTEKPVLKDNGKIHADYTNQQLWFDQELVNLGKVGKTFILVLLDHLGQPVPKQVILDQVWEGKVVRAVQYSEQLTRLKRIFGDAKKDPEGYILHERGIVTMVDHRELAPN